MKAPARAIAAGALLASALSMAPVFRPGVFSPALSAQEASPTQGLVRKRQVPVSDEILKFKLPRPAETTLSNGLRLIVLEDRRLPQISFQLIVPGAGGYADPAEQPGLAAFTAALMREGTPTRTSNQISEQLELMAATLNFAAGSSPEATITGGALSDQAVRLMDLASDVLLRPSFPDEELARFKQRTRAALVQQRANPAFLAAEFFSRAVYGTHPAARISPTLAALDRLTREDLVAFHRGHYLPDRAVLAIAGDVSMFQARLVVEAKLGGWSKPPTAVTIPVAEPEPVTQPKLYFVARPGSVQTNLLVGSQAIERTNADYDALTVMNRIIGGGAMGRLFQHLREEKGYTYGASSALDARQHRGDWAASTNVRTEVTGPALGDLLDEVRQLREIPVPDQELADAKRSMVASFALPLESPAQLLGLYLTQWRFKLPADYWDRYAERVMAVTTEQVQAAARRYLAQDRLQIVVVGDPAQALEALQKLGPVETFDANGNPTTAEK
ncbi:MAG: pitrilysin family protein [Acidobacteriota bacterium]